MVNWEFDLLPPNLVEQDLTQRDQFNNDDVGISEALVREVIQNSTDAGCEEYSGPIKVRFAIRELAGDQLIQVKKLMHELTPHLSECNVDTSFLREEKVRLLVIEDFNTRGLTGSVSELDNGNFHNFWRRHGRSGKGGRAGGRWGLGKLVYSSSSRVRVFWGVTIRESESTPLLMGQCVLSNHEIGDDRFSAFGFYSDRNSNNLQLPISDSELLEEFKSLSGISRTNQSGLSIVIPYPQKGITEGTLLQSVINNYYFPILSGNLIVEINDLIINAERFDKAVEKAGGLDLVPIDFVKIVSNKKDDIPDFMGSSSITVDGISENYIGKDKLDLLKNLYAKGDLVHARLPLELTPKAGSPIQTYIDVFLKSLPDEGKSYALFARGSITVPGEIKYFQGVHAYGAMVVSDYEAVSFLGDAENPAHTAFNERAEKLHSRWDNPARALRAIRHSLRQLYVAISDDQERRDENALIDFFSLADLVQDTKPRRKKKTVKPKPKIPSKQKAFYISPKKGGFTIAPGPAASDWGYPKTMTLQMAYDMLGANPFDYPIIKISLLMQQT